MPTKPSDHFSLSACPLVWAAALCTLSLRTPTYLHATASSCPNMLLCAPNHLSMPKHASPCPNMPLSLPTEQNYCESRYHFLHSADGEGCANMLVEYSAARGFRSEVDMFVAQAVLQ